MEFLKKAEQFRELLESLSHKHDFTGKVTFLEEYDVSVLGANTTTPFTNFIGGRDRLTVIMSRHLSEETDSRINKGPDNIEGMELLVDLDDSGKMKPQGDTLPISSEMNVDIGRPLTRSRVYLNNSSLLHEGWSGAEVVTSTSARDGGLVPIPLDSARFIASLYCLSYRKAKELLPDVWIACEPNNRKIIALGCVSESSNSPVRVIMVEDQGTGSEPDLKIRTDISKTIKSSSTTAFSEYDIMGNSADDTEQIADDFKIQFSWNDPDGMLAPPSENSDAVLKMSTTPGGLFSPVLPTFQELKSLHTLSEIACSKMDWPSSGEDREVDPTAEDKRVKEVENFIENMANPFNRPTDVTVISPSTDYAIFEPRTDLDFTEQLWMLCRNVSSFGELQGMCARVFKAVLQGKVQPFVHRSSTSTLSSLLRQVLLNPDGVNLEDTALKFQLLLSESKLLPCIVQIGIEKLKNDYRSFFLGADICSAEQFGKFFFRNSPPSSPTSTPTLSPLEQCLELCRLHSVLELNAAVMKMIRLPSTIILSTFTKAAMEVFTKDAGFQPFAKTPVFTIPLPAYSPVLKSVVALCSKLSPVIWCMTTRGKTSRGNTVYLAGSRPLFNYLLQDNKNGDCYYLYKCSCEMSS